MSSPLGANGPVSPGDLFFFYGLLKQGAAGMPSHIDLEAGGAFLRPARMRGDLYNLGGYPGLVDGEGLVKGLLYRLDDVALVPLLDEFEDVVPGADEASLYQRVRRAFLDSTGVASGEHAWVYWYNQPLGAARQILTGDWPLRREKIDELH